MEEFSPEQQREIGFTFAKNGNYATSELDFNLKVTPQHGTEGLEYIYCGKDYTFDITVTNDPYGTISEQNYVYEWVVISPPGILTIKNFSKDYIEGYGKTKKISLKPKYEGNSYLIKVSVYSKFSPTPNDTLTTKLFRYNSLSDGTNFITTTSVIAILLIIFILLFSILLFYLYFRQKHT